MKITERVIVSEEGAFRHVNYQEDVRCTPDGSRTILEVFLNRCSLMGERPMMGTIVGPEVVYQTANEVKSKAESLSSFLNGIVKPGDMIGIYSPNRYEWVTAEMAGYMSGCVNVPLYSTFSPSVVRLVFEETGMKVVFVSADKAKLLLENVFLVSGGEQFHVIMMDKDEDVCEKLRRTGVSTSYFDDLANGEGRSNAELYPNGEDLATVCYTSGTSGKPKGVMLTHRNFISSIAAFYRGSTKEEQPSFVNHDGVYLSYLPLAHVMERLCMNISISEGLKVGFYRGDAKMLQMDFLTIKPAFIASVPRILNVFKDRIEMEIRKKNFLVRGMFKLALKYKIWRQKKGVMRSRILDWMIFDKVSEKFGGEIRWILCGAAPLKPEVLYFIQAVFSCRVFQGYGQTENIGAGLLQPLDCEDYDNVGIPYPANEIKLEKISPEFQQECDRRHPNMVVGEIMMRGENITSGYYKRPSDTKALFGNGGWLRTGDIGMYDPAKGLFHIVGRIKDGFKTSQGEYIDPEKLENMYADGNVVMDVCIPRRTDSDKIVAIVVCPDERRSEASVLAHVKRIGEKLFLEKAVTKLEIPHNVVVIRKGFDCFEGQEFLTPTSKKKRYEIEVYFSREIDEALHL
ncbi:AMP-binding enzyme [Ordospora pajunii]|uniref:AMP-binding enzyme n=1 Tax=Ordospora pajunii TaxID=3039483 RepID=UPI0029525FED|nr:AMP-binding enzyme [Ordospora pajunii]KAH9411413.1 AMP-binding enzyme [Ordospora pajunii]